VPLGVCAGIILWNLPLAIGVEKLFPALLAGSVFIWKPSPSSLYSALKIAELGAKIFPPSAPQALSGDRSLGPYFTGHLGIAKIGFTGSVPTGKTIMAGCVSILRRVKRHHIRVHRGEHCLSSITCGSEMP
jgi:acyl-CoA reductase-like NAD-dependent aldehyde dehydrogenase